MAKRKRLEVPTGPVSGELETKSAFNPTPKARMPIADVAGDTAGRAALEEVAREMTAAEEQGRVIKTIAIADIRLDELNRDRMVIDEGEMDTLKASIAERGQQSPIEVLRVSGGGFGLISGLRRIMALKALGRADVLALIRRPEGAQDAYLAMVEENEIRADLSFYERANIAVTATGSGVYPTAKRAISHLFAHTTSAKRTKIGKFVILRDTLGKALRFPAAIPEKLGLDLAAVIEADRSVAKRISDTLRNNPPADAAAERATLERALRASRGQGAASSAKPRQIAPGVALKAGKGRVALSGQGVDDAFVEALEAWAVSHAKGISSKS